MGGERDHGGRQQHGEVGEQDGAVDEANLVEDGVVVDPDDPDDQEADQVGQIRRPLVSEGRGKPTLPQFLARGDAEVEDEQCDGDGEDSIAERPDPLAAHQSGGSRPIRSPLVIHGIASRALLVVRKSCADNGAMAEPRIVVAHREHLWWLLAEAAQLEHMIMCQYLFAEISLKDSTGEGLTEDQAEAVGRWRKTVRGIAVEEMLHLALVANLMTAIGAAPALGRPNFPQRSGYFPSGLQLDLLPFGERALRHFLYLERPEGMERQDAKGFVPTAPPREPVEADELLPRGQEFATVGHLYRGIADGLRGLTERLGERAVFVGSPRAQATPELLRWPQLVAVTDLASALAAVEEIIEQGEGARGDWRPAHYGRFLGIWEEYQSLRRRDPSFEPARPVLPAYTRQPFDITAPQPIVTYPLTHHVAELAGLAYEMVLQLLIRFFTHTEETDEQLSTLISGAIGLMAGVDQVDPGIQNPPLPPKVIVPMVSTEIRRPDSPSCRYRIGVAPACSDGVVVWNLLVGTAGQHARRRGLGLRDDPGGVDQADVAERLRVVADHLGSARVDLLGE